MNKAVFIDKDGTLVEDVPYNVDPRRIRLTEGAIDGLNMLKSDGFLLIVVSNQSGVAHGYFPEEALEKVKDALQELLHVSGPGLDGFFYCPHHPQGRIPQYAQACTCRKPEPGLILKAATKFNVDLSQSWMIGDILNDVEAGNAAGCKTILINNGNETEWILNESRKATWVVRNLKEAAQLIVHQPHRV